MSILNSNFTPESFLNLSDKEKLERLVYYSSLAPSSHNTQPWLFELSQNKIKIYPNLERRLPQSDSTNRELYLSLGAAVTNLNIISQNFGLDFSCNITPNDQSVATFSYNNLKSVLINKKMIEAVCNRHCNRFEYEEKKLPEMFLNSIPEFTNNYSVIASVINEPKQKSQIAEIVLKAIESAFKDKGFTEELSHWLKPSLQKYHDGMPGYNIGVPWLLSFIIPWAMKHFNMSKQQRDINKSPLYHSATYIILSTTGDSKKDWVNTGQALEQIWIEAEKENIKLAVFAAPIEIKDYYKDFQQLLNTSSRPQMFVRLGYTNKIPKPSPRLAINKILMP